MMLLLVLLSCGDKDVGQGSIQVPPADHDQDGFTADVDCDDTDAAVHPDAEELCNQQDDNCDGRTDEGLPTTAWYLDLDADGWGDADTLQRSCLTLEGYVELGGDCDDGDATVNPGAEEICDGLDQDCDNEADNGVPLLSFWLDQDDDGFGDPVAQVQACAQPDGFVDNNDDCDDDDPGAWPGAEEDWTDETDSDCDGQVETAGPVSLTGGTVEELHLTLPEGVANRIVVAQGPGRVTLTSNLSQPTVLILAGVDVTWTVVDEAGTVQDEVRADADAVGLTLDHPLFYDLRTAMESSVGTIASWHAGTASELALADIPAWPERDGWPDCDGPYDAGSFPAPTPAALACPELSSPVCLTATDDAVVAFDFDGLACEVLALDSAPSGGTLLWSGARLLLAQGDHGVLTSHDLVSGSRGQAWLWPQAVLHHGDAALLVPGQPYSDLDPGILYSYAGFGDMQCGDGSNVTGIWADDLSVSTVSEGVVWWPGDDGLQAYELASGAERTVPVADWGEVSGLSALPDGTLAAVVDGALWVIDPGTGVVQDTVSLDVAAHGLACAE